MGMSDKLRVPAEARAFLVFPIELRFLQLLIAIVSGSHLNRELQSILNAPASCNTSLIGAARHPKLAKPMTQDFRLSVDRDND